MREPQYTTVASGDTISGQLGVGAFRPHGLFAPASLTQQIFLQAAWDTTSANFARVQLRDGSGDWSVASATATKPVAVTLEDVLGPFSFARVELGAAATDTRTFALVTKP